MPNSPFPFVNHEELNECESVIRRHYEQCERLANERKAKEPSREHVLEEAIKEALISIEKNCFTLAKYQLQDALK